MPRGSFVFILFLALAALARSTAAGGAASPSALRPGADNYAVFDHIDSPGRDGGDIGPRLCIKFQLSQTFPVWQSEALGGGLGFAMTVRGLFDIYNRAESSPVSERTFIPDVFAETDGRALFPGRRVSVGNPPSPFSEEPRISFRLGLQHESNGGYRESSRGIDFRYYGQYRRSYGEAGPFSRSFALRLFGTRGISANPDIHRYIGHLEWEGHWFVAAPSLFGASRVSLVGFDLFLNPGGTEGWDGGFRYASAGAGLAYMPFALQGFTLYARLWTGYNEFLGSYDRRTFIPFSLGFSFRL